MVEQSVLKPVDAASISSAETEEAAPWIVRKLVGSMTGRIVMSSFETLRATGTSIVCLSPWGDSSPLLLPCIRFRDLAVHAVIVATGGTAALVSPALVPVADVVASSSFASSIVVEVVGVASHEAIVKGGDWLLVDKPIDLLLPKYSVKLQTTSVKVIMIDIKYKHIIDDAALGFFRSPIHKDPSLIANVGDYFSIEKGWLSPYLFSTARRPVIPRTMQADVVFAHGPFLTGDYEVAETLLSESVMSLHFCVPPPPREKKPETRLPITDVINSAKNKLSVVVSPDTKSRTPSPEPPADGMAAKLEAGYKRLSNRFLGHHQSKSTENANADPQPASTPGIPTLPDGIDATDINPLANDAPPPRRMIVLLLGIKPHRGGIWTTSQRPSESVIQYLLLDGCPCIVLPVKPGSPLLAWDTLTLASLHKYAKEGRKPDGVIRIVFEYVSLCVDWERVVISAEEGTAGTTTSGGPNGEEEKTELTTEEADSDGRKRHAVKHAIGLLVEAAMKSSESKEVQDKVDADRAGIAMFRLP